MIWLTIKFILVLLATALADACWTKWMLEVGNKNAMKAGIWSSIIVAISVFTVMEYTTNRVMGVAAIIGAFVGTYFTVVFHKETKTNE